MDGVAHCARISLATTRLAYSRPAEAAPALYAAALSGQGSPAARRALEQFEALMPYLQAIGNYHALDPFDLRVVEAYWIGNELLEPFGRPQFAALLDSLRRRGLPRSLTDRLVRGLPERPMPHHVFHVAYVGVGNVTGHVETTLANIEACRPARWRVASIDEGSLSLLGAHLELDHDRIRLGSQGSRKVAYEPPLLPELRVGDDVAVHWGLAGLRLSSDQARRLDEWTVRSLASAASTPAFGSPAGSAP